MRFSTRDPTPVARDKGPRDLTAPTGSVIVPTIASFCMDLCVTGLAKGNQITSCVSATLRQRYLMMDFLCWYQLALLLAPLTQWVLLNIAVTDTLPSPSISTAYSRVSVILLIALGFSFYVFLTEPTICKPWTAGVRTRALGFLWHRFTSLGHKKSPTGLLP